MLKQTISYLDFDGNPRERTEYFNLTKAEIIQWEAEFSTFKIGSGDEKGEAKGGVKEFIEEVLRRGKGAEIMDLYIDVLRRSYGIKSEDGESFEKGDEIFGRFTKTAAFDKFLENLLTGEINFEDFIEKVMPNGLVAAARAEAAKDRDKPAPDYRPMSPNQRAEQSTANHISEASVPTQAEPTPTATPTETTASGGTAGQPINIQVDTSAPGLGNLSPEEVAEIQRRRNGGDSPMMPA